MQEGYPDIIKPTEKNFTVVIFSSPTKERVEKTNISLQDITWPETPKDHYWTENDIAGHFVDRYSKMLHKSCRIICIDAFSSGNKLSGDVANSVLKYLKISIQKCDKCRLIDVIILPKFFLYTGNYAREIMESLWYLRKHTVLISNFSQHATLPSTEVIAVAGETEQVKAQGSILDFVVVNSDKPPEPAKEDNGLLDHDDSLDGTIVQSFASAVVSDVALQIISSLTKTSISGNMLVVQ